MKLDRELQNTLLKALADFYPQFMGLTALGSKYERNEFPENEGKLLANLIYLQQHQLIVIRKAQCDGDEASFAITHQGLDFLADDGGLSAILGVVTIRLHDDTIKELIQLKIMKSDLPPADKKRFVDSLKELPAETTKHLVMKLVDLGLDKLPMAGLLGLVGTAAAVAPT